MTARFLARAAASLAAVIVAAAALAGCRKTDDIGAPPCPQVALLADAAHQTKYRDGPGRDLTDVLYEADLSRITGECIYKRHNTSVTVEMKLLMVAKRGAADRDRYVDLHYFVAIVDNQSNVLARKEFQTRVDFAEQIQVTTQEELEQIIPLKKNQAGSDFEVLVGFELTPDQLERNRGVQR